MPNSDPGQRIVAAANRFRLKDGTVLTLVGARHCDKWMQAQMEALDEVILDYIVGKGDEQGFINNRGTFLTREEAWEVAQRQGQIIRRCGGDSANGGTLYSENLY